MDALRQWLTNKTALASLAAIALFAGGVVLAPSSATAATPTIARADTEWHDGLNPHRYPQVFDVAKQ